jgi:hypothetical protein
MDSDDQITIAMLDEIIARDEGHNQAALATLNDNPLDQLLKEMDDERLSSDVQAILDEMLKP